MFLHLLGTLPFIERMEKDSCMGNNQRLISILASGNLQDAQIGVGLSIRSANGVVLSGAVLGALRSDLALAFMGHNQGVVICLARSHPQDTLVWVGLAVRSANWVVLSGAVLGTRCSNLALTLMRHDQ